MLKTRIIPVLLLKHYRMVKGKQFNNYRDTGDPVSAAKIYNFQDADELVFIDIEASNCLIKDRKQLYNLIEKVSEECFMPLTIGGGVDSIEDIRSLLKAGADKVLICSAAVKNPRLIKEASDIFGTQCIVICIDVKLIFGNYVIYTNCSKQIVNNLDIIQHIKLMEQFGAGEIIINNIDNDGMMMGYDLKLLSLVVKNTSLPVIAMGGAGDYKDLLDALNVANVHAVACSSLFHFGDNNPLRAKAYLKNNGINLKKI